MKKVLLALTLIGFVGMVNAAPEEVPAPKSPIGYFAMSLVASVFSSAITSHNAWIAANPEDAKLLNVTMQVNCKGRNYTNSMSAYELKGRTDCKAK